MTTKGLQGGLHHAVSDVVYHGAGVGADPRARAFSPRDPCVVREHREPLDDAEHACMKVAGLNDASTSILHINNINLIRFLHQQLGKSSLITSYKDI